MKEVIEDSLIWCEMEEEITSLSRFSVIPEAQDDPEAPACRSATHPHRYTLLTVFHHGLFDGQTTINISSIFIETLNLILDGKIVDDSVMKGVFLPGGKFPQIEKTLLSNNDPNTIPEKSLSNQPVILKGFPPPGGHSPTTIFIFNTVESDAMAIIKAACKREGVTFHSVVMAAHQTATMELLQSSGVQDDTATFCVNMATDLRRYMAENTLPIHGLHISRSKMFIETNNNTQKSGFWEFARNIEIQKRKVLNSQDLLHQIVATEKGHTGEDSLPETFDYGITALREIETAPNRFVQVTGATLYVFVHNTLFMSFLTYLIGRQKYVFTFSCASNLMAKKTAKMLLDKTLHILQKRASPNERL
ncbi:hypothetical protein GWK47_019908 [Chionoecetes opilio]|uniref:Condensation domain-containing protein n=1 Tax=Chionoecetes opilio TaxID=41210 RepID=A0A8J4XU53_CHIOP|nr:hypothetical protein GWK47_019908 [Chionoecetes opilio]